MAGVKAGARPAVQEAQVGRRGGTARREVCWQAWSFRDQQEPMILKSVRLLSVFFIFENQGSGLVLPWLSTDTDNLSRASQHTISFSNFSSLKM